MSSQTSSSTILSWLDSLPPAASSPCTMSPNPPTEKDTLSQPTTPPGKAQHNIPSTGLDDDATPKPFSASTPSSGDPPPSFDLQPLRSTISEVSLESKASARSKASQYTINSTYSITQLPDFDSTTNPVVERSFEEFDAPSTVESLISDLRNISDGRKHIPAVLLDHAPFRELYGNDLDAVASPAAVSWLQELRGTQRAAEILWDALEECVSEAKDCKARKGYEAEWNEEVHSNLLRIVLRGPWRKRHVWYRNVTQARLKTGETLLPTRVTDVRPISPKMIDFVIIHDPPKNFLERIKRAIFQARGIKSVNQTDACSVRSCPIVVNIETKTPEGNEEEALIQLLTWSAAQFNKLQQLNPLLSDSQLLPIPLIVIHGHAWRFFLAEKQADGSILLAGHIVLGTTEDMRGILKIAAAIERLAHWAETEFVDWYTRNILDPLAPS